MAFVEPEVRKLNKHHCSLMFAQILNGFSKNYNVSKSVIITHFQKWSLKIIYSLIYIIKVTQHTLESCQKAFEVCKEIRSFKDCQKKGKMLIKATQFTTRVKDSKKRFKRNVRLTWVKMYKRIEKSDSIIIIKLSILFFQPTDPKENL